MPFYIIAHMKENLAGVYLGIQESITADIILVYMYASYYTYMSIHTPLNVLKGGYLLSKSAVTTEFETTSDRRNANVLSISCCML